MLLETLVAISLISVVMAAFTTFFINSVAFTNQQRSAQIATTIANSAMDTIRALQPSKVETQAVKTSSQTVNNVVYSVASTFSICAISATVTVNAICATRAPLSTEIGYLRAVVTVTWPGANCPSRVCSYVTSTLISTVDDPKFDPIKPPSPTMDKPLDQVSAVNDTVNLVLTSTAIVPPLMYQITAGTLPAGLTLAQDTGLISGTPSAQAPSTSLSMTVTDGFGRISNTVSFTWTILAALTAAPPVNQATILNVAISALTVTASGGSPGYTWSDPVATLPPGLTINAQGVISGTPTSVGAFPLPFAVTLTVTDSKGRSTPVIFTWTISYPPIAATNPGAQTSTQGTADGVTLSATGGSGSFAWTSETLPAGLTLSSAGVISGTPTSLGTTSVTLVVTDTKVAGSTQTVAFNWVVFPRPSVDSLSNQTWTVGKSVTLTLTKNCPNVPCTYAMTNGPATFAISNSGVLTGTVTSAAQTFSGVTIKVTDSSGAIALSPIFTVTVTAASSAPLAPSAVLAVNGDGAVTVSWTAPAGPVTSYTATLSSGGASCTTTGLSCVISGLTNGVAYSLTVTATNYVGSGPGSTAVTAIPYPAVMSGASGMTLWLDGADPAVLFGSSNSACTGVAATTTIGCWKDKSGQGQNFIQTNTANQPGITTWNGLKAANFADSSDVLNSVTATGQYQTVFVAANITNAANIVDLFGRATQDYNVRVGSGVGRSETATTKQNQNDWSYKTDNTGWQFDWANGAQGAQVTVPTAVITSDQAASVQSFQASVSNTFMNRGVVGQIGDVITFNNKDLKDTDRRAVEEYLAHKWGVAITPQAPTAVAADSPKNNRATVTWTAPSFDGGAAVSGYTVTSSSGDQCTTTGALSCKFTQLGGKTYTFTVTATNSVGTGPASAASNTVTP